ncbi:chymotrypsin BII-like [Penaeus japonicus]|uniref:chymotrypsin BII-like n=1 Tax=Penaeus japonicus TaxID=27405 RepID=UPI001C70F60D|nr:chymotrypsin BII-like [Penaeus japonicus]
MIFSEYIEIVGAGFVEVVLGAHYIRHNEPSQVSLTSTDFFTHEHWNSHRLTNDIALIKLPSPVQFNLLEPFALYQKPLLLMNIAEKKVSPQTGAGGISDVLRQVDVPIMEIAECSAISGHLGIGVVSGMGTCNVRQTVFTLLFHRE